MTTMNGRCAMSKRPALTKAAVFRFILDTWGRNAFRGYNAHTIPREYDEWLKESDKLKGQVDEIVGPE